MPPNDPNPHSPWIFQRDEFDLLEAEFDQIFERHEDRNLDPAIRAMEDEIIDEQISTEEEHERQLQGAFQEFGWEIMSTIPFQEELLHPPEELRQPLSIGEMMKQDSTLDPLYTHAFSWATRIFRWSGSLYYKKRTINRDLFRVHINVYIVPAKISFARNEEAHQEPRGLQVALKEYELAGIYLERVLESLQSLAVSGYKEIRASFVIAEGEEILSEIDNKMAGLKRRMQFAPDDF